MCEKPAARGGEKPHVKHETSRFETQELNEEARAIDVRELSPLGKRLAEAYAKSIRNTRYIKENWTLRHKVHSKVLEEFGSVGGLCELSGKKASDREARCATCFSPVWRK